MKVLSGDSKAVKALIEYFIKGRSPAEVAWDLGVSQSALRGWIHRIHEKTHNPAKSATIFKAVIDAMDAVEVPTLVMRSESGRMKCLICGELIPANKVRYHIMKEHKDIMNHYINEVIKNLNHDRISNGLKPKTVRTKSRAALLKVKNP